MDFSVKERNMIIKLFKKTCRNIAGFNRNIINFYNRKRLKNRDFSIICNNCIGGFILHDLGLRFLTPTINLFISAEDFIKFVENLDYYFEQKLINISNSNYDYPVGKLEDITVHFVHYNDFNSAKEKWEDRVKRINKENLFIMMTQRDGCTLDIIKRFDKLKYKNKVLFAKESYKQFKSTYYIKGFEKEPEIGNPYKYKNIFGFKYYDSFDYITWFNRGIIKS